MIFFISNEKWWEKLNEIKYEFLLILIFVFKNRVSKGKFFFDRLFV